jgi:hypothetical protein
MSRKVRILLVVGVCLILGLEIAVRLAGGSRNGVQIVNEGSTPMENLVVSFDGSNVAVGNVAPGQTARVLLSGERKGSITLTFQQKENPLSSFQIPDYDPRALRRDRLEMVVLVKMNQVGKYLDDQRSTTPVGRLLERIESQISGELDFP